MDKIPQFRGWYRFLSNMHPCQQFEFNGCLFSSSENMYQASKIKPELRTKWLEVAAMSPKKSKVYMNSHPELVRDDWHEIKVNVMRMALEFKFRDPKLRSDLIATKDTILEEGNTWGDEFWGINLRNGKGKNMLGILLMEHRSKLQSSTRLFGE